MATENSEPKSGIIVKIGLLGIAGILATRFALVPFFDRTVDQLHYERSGAVASQEWHQVRDSEMKRLSEGPVSIDAAKAAMIRKARSGLDEALVPHASTDFASLEGWSNEGWKPMPRTLPTTLIPAEPAPLAAGDGGLLDAGPMPAPDAGPHPALPANAVKGAGPAAPPPPVPGHK